jgi:hypothetical protein
VTALFYSLGGGRGEMGDKKVIWAGIFDSDRDGGEGALARVKHFSTHFISNSRFKVQLLKQSGI